jgi:hypothetical protein
MRKPRRTPSRKRKNRNICVPVTLALRRNRHRAAHTMRGKARDQRLNMDLTVPPTEFGK